MRTPDFLREHVLFILITALVICGGLFVPRIILSAQSNLDVISKGKVDAAEIQPYGADIILKEQFLRSGLDFLYDHINCTGFSGPLLENSWEYDPRVTVSNLGHISWNADHGNYRYPIPEDGFGLTQELLRQIKTTFYMNIDGDHGLRYLASPGEPGGGYVVIDGRGIVYMEGRTGLPLKIDVAFASEGHGSLNEFAGNVVSIYSEMSGIRFVDLTYQYETINEEGRDTCFSREYRSSDGEFILTVEANSWPYSYRRNSDDGLYAWNIMINISEPY